MGTALSWEFSGAAGKYRLEAEVAATGEAPLGVVCGSTKSVAKIAPRAGSRTTGSSPLVSSRSEQRRSTTSNSSPRATTGAKSACGASVSCRCGELSLVARGSQRFATLIENGEVGVVDENAIAALAGEFAGDT